MEQDDGRGLFRSDHTSSCACVCKDLVQRQKYKGKPDD